MFCFLFVVLKPVFTLYVVCILDFEDKWKKHCRALFEYRFFRQNFVPSVDLISMSSL